MDEFSVSIPRTAPHIKPGDYEARSIRHDTHWIFRRKCFVLWFDVIVSDGELVRLPAYFRLPPDGRLAPSSKLARVFGLLPAHATNGSRSDRYLVRSLHHRLWRVTVRDVHTGSSGKELATPHVYSVVGDIFEHIG